MQVSLTCLESNGNQPDKLSMEYQNSCFNEICRHEIFSDFWQISEFFLFQIIISKVV